MKGLYCVLLLTLLNVFMILAWYGHLQLKQYPMIHLATKEDLVREICGLRSEVLRTVYVIGLVQFLAIAGTVFGIVKLSLK